MRWASWLSLASWARLAPSMTSRIGESRWGGNSVFIAVSTWRALADVGSTVASTAVNLIAKNGIPSAISSVALAAAIRPGRRITKRDSLYQKPDSVGRASRSARAWRNAGASELTRVPSNARMAGRTTSARPAAIRATSEPPRPIE